MTLKRLQDVQQGLRETILLQECLRFISIFIQIIDVIPENVLTNFLTSFSSVWGKFSQLTSSSLHRHCPTL